MTSAFIVAADLLLAGWWVRTLLAIWRRPATRWGLGRAGRILALVAAALLVGAVHGIILPWGAFLVRRAKLRGEWPSTELPMADGRPGR